ncbi:ubiquinol oxidase subunit II [Halomonadaceae bacterium KBTZ08]
MRKNRHWRLFGAILLGLLPLVLSGCSSALMDPKGQVGEEQRVLILTAFALMLIVVVPVIVMTLVFAWRYREGNKEASYRPDWAHSTAIEVVVWLIPCLIIVVLAILTYWTSHSLDPMKPIETDSEQDALEIQAVSLDWKWLFIYPDQQIATVNEVAFPEDRPIHFRVTSGSVMNAFFIPALGTQIYAMAGMDANLNLIANEKGTFEGRSTNYSGAGFSGMTFQSRALSESGFREWVRTVKDASGTLTYPTEYNALAKPSHDAPVQYYSDISEGLYGDILDRFRKAPEMAGQAHEGGHTDEAVE